MTDAVVAEGLVKTFGETRALDGLDLAVPEGTVLGLLGPNGAGKTTAVRVFSTLLRPDSGRAEVLGFDVTKQPQPPGGPTNCSSGSTWSTRPGASPRRTPAACAAGSTSPRR